MYSRYLIIDNHFFSRKNIGRIINTITSICRENMLVYLSLDIISPSKLTVSLKLCSRKPILISQQIVFVGIAYAHWRHFYLFSPGY